MIFRAENGHCFDLFKGKQLKITYFYLFEELIIIVKFFQKEAVLYKVGLSSRTFCAYGPNAVGNLYIILWREAEKI
jgi:hypothetical protein